MHMIFHYQCFCRVVLFCFFLFLLSSPVWSTRRAIVCCSFLHFVFGWISRISFSVENWEIFEQMLDYTYNRHIKSESHLHPVMMSEPSVSIALKIYVFGTDSMTKLRKPRSEYKNLSWVWGADRKIRPRVTVWHHEAVPSDAKRWSRGTDFSVRAKIPW